jgi:hypothetical protein
MLWARSESSVGLSQSEASPNEMNKVPSDANRKLSAEWPWKSNGMQSAFTGAPPQPGPT